MNGKERMVAIINAAIAVHSGPGDYSKRASVIAEALIADSGGTHHLVHVHDFLPESIIQHPIVERFGMEEGNLFACQDGYPIMEHMNARLQAGQDDCGKTFRIYMSEDAHEVRGLEEVKHAQAGE